MSRARSPVLRDGFFGDLADPERLTMLQGYGAEPARGRNAHACSVAFSSLGIAAVAGLGRCAGQAVARRGRSTLVGHGLYTTLIRAVPDLVMMLLVFYGGQMLVNQIGRAAWAGTIIDINPFVAGVLTIGFIFGAYLTEVLRGAFLAVPPGQREAAQAYGMNGRAGAAGASSARRCCAMRCLALSNNWLVMIKSTSIVSVIGLTDMMSPGRPGGWRHPRALLVLPGGGSADVPGCSPACPSWALPGWQKRLRRGQPAGGAVNFQVIVRQPAAVRSAARWSPRSSCW